MNKSFKKEDLKELVAGGEVQGLVVIEDKLTSTSRWSHHYRLIFKDVETGQLYQTTYRRGATEYQDERPFQDEGDVIECEEVQPVQETITVYKPV